MELKNNFLALFMEKDLDVRLVPKGKTIHVENFNILSPIGSKKGTAKPVRGNKQLSTFNFGSNAKWMGHDVDRLANKIRWLVKSDTGNYFVEYNVDSDTPDIILEDTRGAATNVLNLQDGFPSHAIRTLNDVDNGRTFVFIADGFNELFGFELGTAKNLTVSAFEEGGYNAVESTSFERSNDYPWPDGFFRREQY